MTDHPNLEAARKGYAAFDRGDMGEVQNAMANNIVWHVGGENMMSGDYQGKEAVLGLFARIFEESGGTFKNTIHDILANDEHGVALVNTTGSRGGRQLNERSVHSFHMKDGMMTEFWNFPEDQSAFDAFWA